MAENGWVKFIPCIAKSVESSPHISPTIFNISTMLSNMLKILFKCKRKYLEMTMRLCFGRTTFCWEKSILPVRTLSKQWNTWWNQDRWWKYRKLPTFRPFLSWTCCFVRVTLGPGDIKMRTILPKSFIRCWEAKKMRNHWVTSLIVLGGWGRSCRLLRSIRLISTSWRLISPVSLLLMLNIQPYLCQPSEQFLSPLSKTL